MTKILNLLILLRPTHWVKNLFVFIPIFFAGELNVWNKLENVLFSFCSFCLISSAVYIINDINDINNDKAHPIKRKRPLASGQISVGQAWRIFVIILILGVASIYWINNYQFIVIIASYLLINISYSLGLKRVSIVELLMVSSGFVLRILAGGWAANVEVSQWMVVMIFLLALFITLAKRRDDILLYKTSGNILRKSIENYSLEFINSLLIMISGIIIVAYLMYVISPEVMTRFHSAHLYITSIFVISGIMRYLQITLVENQSGSPTKILFTDNFIRLVVISWIVSFYLIIYHL
jgi:decaprenyl-phosphate phosphoribosyltransferase